MYRNNKYGILTGNKDKVILTCPNGHQLYKEGITVGSLYKSHKIRLHYDQCVKHGYDWDINRDFFERNGCDMEGVEEQIKANRSIGVCPTYALTEDQYAGMKRRCRVCEEIINQKESED